MSRSGIQRQLTQRARIDAALKNETITRARVSSLEQRMNSLEDELKRIKAKRWMRWLGVSA